jgi:glyoxylase-like metal-dependent hydrolase (beta-lactamase superfamily II)
MEVRGFTVGPVQENCYLLRRDGADRAVMVDPGDDAPALLAGVAELGVTLDAILLTHTHFDHVGAVAPVARATGAPVYCPQLEVPVLADIMSFVPWAGFGPYESYDADETVAGGETLELAGMTIEVVFTPGHSPGHVTFVDPGRERHVQRRRLFQGSVGRTDLPGGDWPTLAQSIATLLERYPDDMTVCPGTWASPRSAASARRTPSCRAGAVLKAPRGTFDVLPEQQAGRERVADAAKRVLEGAGYRRIETPTFEATELFSRGVGASTDIVQKEMYTFEDGGGRSITLRPEGTAPVCRAYASTGCTSSPQPVKLWYLSSFFRYERAQAGPLPAVLAGRGGGDRLGRPGRRRRVDRPARTVLEDVGVEGLGCGSRRSGPRTRAALPRAARRAPARPRGPLSEEVRARIDLNPAAGVRRRPRRARARSWRRRRGCSTSSRPTTPSTSPRCARCSTPPSCRT